jgi:nucleoside-diphosphate-sugar epimerase
MTGTRRALVTGSAGFVGRHISAALTAAGYTVTGIDLLTGHDARFTYEYDVGIYPYDLVVHCAAVVGGRTMIDGRPLELAVTDLTLDAALFAYALRLRPRHVVYFSSSAAYPTCWQTETMRTPLAESLIDHTAAFLGAPDQTYGLVKLVGERLALEAVAEGINVTVVRPFSGYGADQALDYPFPTFIEQARTLQLRRRGRLPANHGAPDTFKIWGTGDQVRDFIHIDDVVAGTLKLVELGVTGPVNLGTGRPTSFNELAALILAAAGVHGVELEHLVTKPVGVAYRVANTALMGEYFRPTVTLEAGIRKALV